MRISDWSSDVCSSDLRAYRCGETGKLPERRRGIALRRHASTCMDRVEATCRLRGGIKHSYNEQLPGKITAMLSPEQNERITRTGPETSPGKGVRRYWVPALVEDQLPEAGGDPVRVTLFNADFVLFRAGTRQLGSDNAHIRPRER